jgi:hypothetical protein
MFDINILVRTIIIKFTKKKQKSYLCVYIYTYEVYKIKKTKMNSVDLSRSFNNGGLFGIFFDF